MFYRSMGLGCFFFAERSFLSEGTCSTGLGGGKVMEGSGTNCTGGVTLTTALYSWPLRMVPFPHYDVGALYNGPVGITGAQYQGGPSLGGSLILI